MTVFGVHTGLQHTDTDELQALWRDIERWGYGFISIWDHFYAATFKPEDANCLEAIAAHTALAMTTSRVRCGSLVYCAGYRHPAVLANAIATIDRLSGGRVDLGLGAGWAQVEYEAYGIPFPKIGTRMDILEEAVQCVRGLLREETTTFEGEHFQLRDARLDPKPVQRELPIWIGGTGEQRTLRIAARYADVWNAPFLSPESFASKRQVLAQRCEEIGRDPGEIRTTINLGLSWSEEDFQVQFGNLGPAVRPGVLMGTQEEVVDRIGSYVEAGADQINIAVRAPFDPASLQRLAEALGLEGEESIQHGEGDTVNLGSP